MKKIIIFIVLILCLSGCQKPKTIEELKNDLAENPSDISISAQLIDSLLLNDQKDEAYEVLLAAKEYITNEEDAEKLKEHIENIPIRLVEVDHYTDGVMTNVTNYLYDENGRIVSDDDLTYIYPDDGGNIYYYTLSSWYDNKIAYDKEGNKIYIPPINSEVEYDENGKVIKEIIPLTHSNGNKERNYTYDDLGRLIKSTFVTNYENSNNTYTETTYKYDAEDRVVKEVYNYSYGDNDKTTTETSYTYDENGDLVEKVIGSNERWSDGFYSYLDIYKYEYVDHKNTYEYEKYECTSMHADASKREDETWREYDDHNNIIKTTNSFIDYEGKPCINVIEYFYEYDPIYDVMLKRTIKYDSTNIAFTDEYIYELVKPDSSHVGLTSMDAITFVSGNATRAVIQREIIASNIKIRTLPEISDNNQTGKVKKGEIYYIYNSVYNDGYAWHQIGIDQWIADDGTWTKIVNQ